MSVYLGKKPPSPPKLGRPARVIAQEEVDVEESQEDSQECDPLLDHSYAGNTNGPEAEDENLSHEAQVETASAPEAEDENVNVSREAEVENAAHRIWKPEELATTERHRSRRIVANQAYLQEASRRMNAPTPNVVRFKAGDLTSIKVPRSDRHKTDCKRILGIVVNQHGEKDPSFRIRCKHGMLAGRYRGDSLLPFQGAIPELSVDGWKDDNVISLRTASMCFSKAACPANVCKCRVGCQSRRCICFRNKIQCQAAYHAGRCCQNGMEHDNAMSEDLENMESEELDSSTEDHQCDILITFKVFAQQLIESGFQETECQSCLSAISHAGSWEALSSTARYIAESLPDLQTEEPILIIHERDQFHNWGSLIMICVPT